MAVYLRQRHKARSIGSEPASARDDYATAVSPSICSHKLGSLKLLVMSQVQALSVKKTNAFCFSFFNEAHLRCMKNEAGLRPMKRACGTRKGTHHITANKVSNITLAQPKLH
ncbi:MAG: hypothetical protein IJD59_01035 [Clostridia bacterium]|nr:hypothetical protein [Clostridia bacterium]